MNEATLSSRRRDTPEISTPSAPALETDSRLRTLGDLTREELLKEALYNPTSDEAAIGALDEDRLREEVRWRRSASLREPSLAALAKLLSKVSGDSFERLSQGEFSPAQLIAKAETFKSGRNGVKILKIPDRVEDLERRMNNLEANSDPIA